MQILVSIGTVGASPQIGEILPPCDFFVLSLPFFSILHPGRTAGPIFTLYGSNYMFSHKDGPLGVKTMNDNIWGNYAPKTPKMGLNTQFQAKMAKYKNHNIFKTINWIKTKFDVITPLTIV